jgi:hypothetical protein
MQAKIVDATIQIARERVPTISNDKTPRWKPTNGFAAISPLNAKAVP